MAAALDAEDICAICRNEQKVDPVVLECGHSYCSNCLVEFLDHCLPIADNPGTTGNPNQPIVSAPEQTSINQPNDSDIGIGFSCPQCRRPIVLDFLQNHTSSIHIRIDHISENMQRQYRRRRRQFLPSATSSAFQLGQNQLSQLLVFCISIFIFGLIQACLLSLNAERIRNNPKCQPIALSRIFNAFCLVAAILGCSLGMCKVWLHINKQLFLLYRFGVLVCLVYLVSDIVQAIEGCTQPVATLSTVFVSCINGVLFFLVAQIIKNPSVSLRDSLNLRFNQVQPSQHGPTGVGNGRVYPWRQGTTSGNQEAIITITATPIIP